MFVSLFLADDTVTSLPLASFLLSLADFQAQQPMVTHEIYESYACLMA
jgi:hypothetical protein